ncbi:hypothetical protein [Mordavella massiliensis]|uniref:Uncharacterized protein n=1 Tax=Mordavella massiliensis TaxID=1871024 RepID=A0A938XBQ8_9CLOT|nr:hypothetical protein [Mordavella massiliensis]MBM6948132.1 hypothetical protein [Mordavella massiliensis]
MTENKKQTAREAAEENRRIIDSFDYLSGAASAHECTGLIPSLPASEAERQSYQDLYAYQYLPPKFPPEKARKEE